MTTRRDFLKAVCGVSALAVGPVLLAESAMAADGITRKPNGQVVVTVETGVPPDGGCSEKTKPISRATAASGAAARSARGSAMWSTGDGRPGSLVKAEYAFSADTS